MFLPYLMVAIVFSRNIFSSGLSRESVINICVITSLPFSQRKKEKLRKESKLERSNHQIV